MFGTVRVTYTVNDGQRESDETSFEIVIAPVDDAPFNIFMTGDRNVDATDGNNEDGEGPQLHVLHDGKIVGLDATDGSHTDGGSLSADDIEGGDSPFIDEDDEKELTHLDHFAVTGGADAALFEVAGQEVDVADADFTVSEGDVIYADRQADDTYVLARADSAADIGDDDVLLGTVVRTVTNGVAAFTLQREGELADADIRFTPTLLTDIGLRGDITFADTANVGETLTLTEAFAEAALQGLAAGSIILISANDVRLMTHGFQHGDIFRIYANEQALEDDTGIFTNSDYGSNTNDNYLYFATVNADATGFSDISDRFTANRDAVDLTTEADGNGGTVDFTFVHDAGTANTIRIGDATNGFTLTDVTGQVSGITLLVATGGTTDGVVDINSDFHITINFDVEASVTLSAIRDALHGHTVRHMFAENISADSVIDGTPSTQVLALPESQTVSGITLDAVAGNLLSFGFSLAADASLDGGSGAALVGFNNPVINADGSAFLNIRFGSGATKSDLISRV